jgi:hypothetical protein
VFFDNIVVADQDNIQSGDANEELSILAEEGCLRTVYPKEKTININRLEGDPRFPLVEINAEGVIFQKNTGLAHRLRASIIDAISDLNGNSAISASAVDTLRASSKGIFENDERNFGNFELVDSIYSPKETVPFDDILRFKEDRRSELIRLQSWIERQNLSESDGNIRRDKRELELAISDINTCMNETFSTRILKSLNLKFELNGRSIVNNAVGVGIASEVFSIDLATALIAGSARVLASSVNISGGTTLLPPDLPDHLLPFIYAYQARESL